MVEIRFRWFEYVEREKNMNSIAKIVNQMKWNYITRYRIDMKNYKRNYQESKNK